MSLIDEVERYRHTMNPEANSNRELSRQSVMESDIGDVTSRDDITDPYELVDPFSYKNTRRGRAQYESDLAQAKFRSEQEEAAYQEWYNSPEQVALRERAAGRNPDLMEATGGSASDVAQSETSPMANIETNGQVASRVIGNVTSIVGSLASVASLATAFSDLPLKAQNLKNAGLTEDAINLANTDALKSLISSDISDLLGTAVQAHLDSDSLEPFNYDSFFADDSNFAPLESVYGHFSSFKPALSLARKQSLRFHKNASELQKGTLSEDFSVGTILSDPRLSSSQKLTAIQVRPYTEACIASDFASYNLSKALSDYQTQLTDFLDPEVSASAQNSKNSYESEYFGSLDGRLVASFEDYFRECSRVSMRLEKSINSNYISMFESDPNGESGWRAAYLYGSNGGASWNEAYMSHFSDKTQALVDSLVAEANVKKDTAKLRAMLGAIENLTRLENSWSETALWKSRMREIYNDTIKLCEQLELSF